MLAKFQIIGRTTKNTELTQTSNGTDKAVISLAVNGKDETSFFNITCYNKLAELCAKYVQKGKQVYAEGTIIPRSYEKDGKKVYVTDYVLNNVEFLGGNAHATADEEANLPF